MLNDLTNIDNVTTITNFPQTPAFERRAFRPSIGEMALVWCYRAQPGGSSGKNRRPECIFFLTRNIHVLYSMPGYGTDLQGLLMRGIAFSGLP
jgi:hypothetical protein